MKHPFDLTPTELEVMDLDFAEQLIDEQDTPIGGAQMTTMALGEKGGVIKCISAPYPGESGERPYQPIQERPLPLTRAWFEAGGVPIYW